MIAKINRLVNFGNYRQFQWGATAVFAKRNLIYGWNYSGKTTLSRLFHVLADPSQLSIWQGTQFEIEFDDGTKLTQSNLLAHPGIRVFNRDFIKANFQQEHKAPAVFIVGGNTIHLRNRIARLTEHQEKATKIKSDLSSRHARLKKELDAAGTSCASAVATLIGDKTYNRTKLQADLERIRANPSSFLLADEQLQAQVSLARSTTVWAQVNSVAKPTTDLEQLRSDLESVTLKTASNQAITELKNNRDLESWVRAGLPHHEHKKECGFCGSEITDDRLSTLRAHFSKAYEGLASEVTFQITALDGAMIQVALPDERDLMPDLTEKFRALKVKVEDWQAWAKARLVELKQLANSKKIALETPSKCIVDTSRNSEIDQHVIDINNLVHEHNARQLQIESERREARSKVELHHAAQFFQTESIASKETAISAAAAKVVNAEALMGKIVTKKLAIEAQIQAQSVAAQKLNEMLQFLLPDNDISVAEVAGGSFEFRRGNSPASNLSDGEKTAITFAYFLATLENNGASLSQSVVFIDDPISSLDSNHIYAVYALITKRLEQCKQLFISTHNNELYTLLKDAWFSARQQFANRVNESSAYYTRRFLDTSHRWNSTLEDMPNLLRRYKSEYHFVFEQLHTFSVATAPSLHEAYTAPNMLRKFLESYLGFKKPCTSKWSDKLDLLFDLDVERTEVQKFSDDASHMQGLNRALQQPDFVTSAQSTVGRVIQALKVKDPAHYTSMCTVIGVTP